MPGTTDDNNNNNNNKNQHCYQNGFNTTQSFRALRKQMNVGACLQCIVKYFLKDTSSFGLNNCFPLNHTFCSCVCVYSHSLTLYKTTFTLRLGLEITGSCCSHLCFSVYSHFASWEVPVYRKSRGNRKRVIFRMIARVSLTFLWVREQIVP